VCAPLTGWCIPLVCRVGWYTQTSNVQRWPALAGFRGLRDPAAQALFNATMFAFSESWGDNITGLMSNLHLPYTVDFVGSETALALIKNRLKADLPTLFYLWTPHALHLEYDLERIQLPRHSSPGFAAATSDFPIEVGSTHTRRPRAHALYTRTLHTHARTR
jgi:ABC-type proline/glycine betaine transport system substrate-binding protein